MRKLPVPRFLRELLRDEEHAANVILGALAATGLASFVAALFAIGFMK